MKEVLSLFTFGIGALFFVVFFTTLKPDVVIAAPGPGKPGYCSTKASPALACRVAHLCRSDSGLMSGSDSGHHRLLLPGQACIGPSRPGLQGRCPAKCYPRTSIAQNSRPFS